MQLVSQLHSYIQTGKQSSWWCTMLKNIFFQIFCVFLHQKCQF